MLPPRPAPDIPTKAIPPDLPGPSWGRSVPLLSPDKVCPLSRTKFYDILSSLSPELQSPSDQQNRFFPVTHNSKFLKMHDMKFSDLQGAFPSFSLIDCIPSPQLGPSFHIGTCNFFAMHPILCWLWNIVHAHSFTSTHLIFHHSHLHARMRTFRIV